MSDPVSITAAVIGFAHIAIKLGRELSVLISQFREASTELRRLHGELEELNKIIVEIMKLSQTYQNSDLFRHKSEIFDIIENVLKGCADDMSELKNIVEQPSAQTITTLNRFKISIKSVFNEDKILRISSRLVERKKNLDLLLSITLGSVLVQLLILKSLGGGRGLYCIHFTHRCPLSISYSVKCAKS
jgi:hypothetical protein